ncbi:MAG: hypothetical protein NC122_06235 [Faecalibacterium sp.]|nr:hypothetical protein [Ruminococcus sp.]MCM1392092.1 hypothetical protein [Ruminococcus sp.]MCM1485789.1 hypothetical protein [Faecalibacterium sp.]
MTLKDVARQVSRLQYLKREKQRIEYRIEELDSARNRTTPIISDMPKGGGNVDKIGLYFELILEQKERLEAVSIALCSEEKNLETFFADIRDDFVRQSLEYKYIDGLTWVAVAQKIGNNTADSVRMACIRYLAKM